jgi:hypothetical protein
MWSAWRIVRRRKALARLQAGRLVRRHSMSLTGRAAEAPESAVIRLIESAVRAGAYRVAARSYPRSADTFEAAADKWSLEVELLSQIVPPLAIEEDE